MDEVSFKPEGGNSIANGFFCVGSGFSNRFSYLLQNFLNRRWELHNIFINGGWYRVTGFHTWVPQRVRSNRALPLMKLPPPRDGSSQRIFGRMMEHGDEPSPPLYECPGVLNAGK